MENNPPKIFSRARLDKYNKVSAMNVWNSVIRVIKVTVTLGRYSDKIIAVSYLAMSVPRAQVIASPAPCAAHVAIPTFVNNIWVTDLIAICQVRCVCAWLTSMSMSMLKLSESLYQKVAIAILLSLSIILTTYLCLFQFADFHYRLLIIWLFRKHIFFRDVLNFCC